jgi:AraC-like DNA-binding protein
MDDERCWRLLDPRTPVLVDKCGIGRMGVLYRQRERTLPCHYLLWVLSGRIEVAGGGVATRLGPGGAWWVAPQVAHSLQPMGGRFSMLFLRLRCPELEAPAAAIAVHEAGAVAQLMRSWLAERRVAGDAAPRARALLVLALSGLARQAGRHTGMLSTTQRAAVLDAATGTRASPTTLARAAGLHPDWFARRFRATFGMPPRRWLAEQRVHQAAEAIAAGTLPLAEIARRWGFASQSALSRRCRAVLGMTPTAWRSQHRRP